MPARRSFSWPPPTWIGSRLQRRPNEGAPALWAVKLVGTHRDQIGVELVDVAERKFADLDRVGVELHSRVHDTGSDLRHRLQRADLVVGGRDRDQRGVRTQRPSDVRGIHLPMASTGSRVTSNPSCVSQLPKAWSTAGCSTGEVTRCRPRSHGRRAVPQLPAGCWLPCRRW